MGWFIAIFVTLMIAGSVLWIKPSKRDLRLSELRRRAMAKGIRVRLLDEKLRDNLFPWLEDHRGYSLYENHQFGGREDRSMQAFEVHRKEPLHELDYLKLDVDAKRLQEFEASLPMGVRAVVLFPDGIGLLWDERGDVELVDRLMDSMKVLSAEFS